MSDDSLIKKLEIVRLFVLSLPMHKDAPDTLRALSDIKQAVIRQHAAEQPTEEICGFDDVPVEPSKAMVERVAKALISAGLFGWDIKSYMEITESGEAYNHPNKLASVAIAAMQDKQTITHSALRSVGLTDAKRQEEGESPAKEHGMKVPGATPTDALSGFTPGLTYEQQLDLVESMMTCYDMPLTQAAGYTRDLLKKVIELQQREIPVIDYGKLAAHVASGLGALKGYGHENTAAVSSLQFVLDELMRAYQAPKQEMGEIETPTPKKTVDIQSGATAILWAMKQAKTLGGDPVDHSNLFGPITLKKLAKACADIWGLNSNVTKDGVTDAD